MQVVLGVDEFLWNNITVDISSSATTGSTTIYANATSTEAITFSTSLIDLAQLNIYDRELPEEEVAEQTKRIVRLKDGVIISDELTKASKVLSYV